MKWVALASAELLTVREVAVKAEVTTAAEAAAVEVEKTKARA